MSGGDTDGNATWTSHLRRLHRAKHSLQESEPCGVLIESRGKQSGQDTYSYEAAEKAYALASA